MSIQNAQALLGRLNKREREVFERLLKGLSVNEIASELKIKQQTISTYKLRVFLKLQVQNNHQLTLVGVTLGLVDLQNTEKHLEILTQLQAA